VIDDATFRRLTGSSAPLTRALIKQVAPMLCNVGSIRIASSEAMINGATMQEICAYLICARTMPGYAASVVELRRSIEKEKNANIIGGGINAYFVQDPSRSA
jgi:hypothetical protein